MKAKHKSPGESKDWTPDSLHKQVQAMMSEHESRLRSLFDTMSEGVILIAPDGQIVEANPSAQSILGLTHREITGRNYTSPDWKILRPDGTGMPVQEMAGPRAMREERPVKDMVMGIERPDGSVTWLNVSASPLINATGKLEGVVGTFADITAGKQAEQSLRESEERYRTLVESIPQKIFLKDKNSVYISCNRNYAEDLKIKPEEIAGHTDYNFYPRDLAEKYRADDKTVIESGNTQRIEERYIQQGEERVVETFKTPVRDDSGELVGVMGIFHDITERRKANEALRESEERFRNMTNLLPQTVFEADDKGDITFANREAYQIFGYSEEDVARGINVLQIIAPEDRARAAENLRLRLNGDELPPTEYTAVRKDDSKFPIILYARSITRDGKYARMMGILVDITERKQAEDGLRQSQACLQLIADYTSDAIWALDPDLRPTFQSPSSMARLFGYTLREWKTLDWSDYMHPDDVDTAINMFRGFRRRREQGSATVTMRARAKNGREMSLEVTVSPVRGQDGELTAIVGVARDITERKQAEARLVEYKTAVEQSVDGIALADMEGHIRFVNEAWARTHGYAIEELIGRHVSIFHTGEQYESEVVPFNLRLVETGSNSGEMWHVRRDGGVFPTWMTTTVLKDADQKPFGLLGIMRDITERKEMERGRRDQEIAEARAEELRRSRRGLISAQESLRKEIAGQLHGTVQNRLILLGHKLAELEARPASERTTEELAGIRQKLEELQNDHIRLIAHRLFPSILRLGIVAGLESLADDYGVELPIDLQVSKQLRDREQAGSGFIPDDVKLALYRIAEESLANILKHTPTAKNIVVKLSLSNSRILRLEVSDDGGGFDTAGPGNGIGLAIMSDYAAAAGGSYAMKSTPGKGTRITAQVPLPGIEAGQMSRGQPSG